MRRQFDHVYWSTSVTTLVVTIVTVLLFRNVLFPLSVTSYVIGVLLMIGLWFLLRFLIVQVEPLKRQSEAANSKLRH
jgi:hypothetical protein